MFESLWQSLLDVVTLKFIDISPFWYEWLPLGIGVAVLVMAAAWFFPVLRSLAGAVVVGIAAALFGYRKGEIDYAARHKPKPAPKRQDNPWEWKW